MGAGRRRERAEAMIDVVTMKEIRVVFDVLDGLEISREHVTIPLTPEHPGRVTRLPNGKFEIVVESEEPLAAWLPILREELKRLAG